MAGLAAAVLLVVACGDDAGETRTASSPATTSTPSAADAISTETSAGPTTAPTAAGTQPTSGTATFAPSTTSSAPTTGGSLTTAPGIPSSGPPPWAAEPLGLATLPEAYRLEWIEAGEPERCPFLAFADLGPEAGGATIRRAESDREMLVVWDNPDGPGHDRTSEPCEDCGRGVVGLGTFQLSRHVGEPTIVWDDGSFANVAELPSVYGVSARIQPAGAECIYQLWSHLGYDHVDYLIGQLRRVTG